MKRKLVNRGLSTVQSWYHTLNGLIMPMILMTHRCWIDYRMIDSICTKAFTQMADNYAKFISDLKSMKKILKLAYASNKPSLR